MAAASHCAFAIEANSIPFLTGAEECLKAGFLTRAHTTNGNYTTEKIHWIESQKAQELWPDWRRKIILDPQTSGGLLLSIPEAQADQALELIQITGFKKAVKIGRVVSKVKPYLLEIEI